MINFLKYKQQYNVGFLFKTLITIINNRELKKFTKTKSEVKGGGKKPWKQKGTGRARAGSIRSPLWVKGGICFGPKPRFINKKINKKEKKLAFILLLLLKFKKIIFRKCSNFACLIKPSCKLFIQFLNENHIELKYNTLIIVKEYSKNLWLSAKNIKNINLKTIKNIRLQDILKNKNIIFLSL